MTVSRRTSFGFMCQKRVMEHMVVLKRTFLARERLFAGLLCFVSLRASSDLWRVFAWLWRQLRRAHAIARVSLHHRGRNAGDFKRAWNFAEALS